MLKNLLFPVIICLFIGACTQAQQSENTKTEEQGVYNVNSPITTPPQSEPKSIPPFDIEKNDIPHTPKPVVIKSNTSHSTTSPQPSPERTNVPPAKEVVNPTPSTEKQSASDSQKEAIPTSSPSIQPIQVQTPVNDINNGSEPKANVTHDLTHQLWDELLKKHVNASGKVNYSGLKADKSQLEKYLQQLETHPPQNSWSREKKMAYWINAYNAFTVKLIVDNYPVASITKLEGGKPWDKKWIKIGSNTYSLNNIENDILRPTYKDARIHFAVNCAAKSCPPLLNKAWTANNLEINFEQQAKAFINNAAFNNITSNKIQVSKIFEWYAEDFGNLIDYLNKYSTNKIKPSAKVEYLEYNWDLNG